MSADLPASRRLVLLRHGQTAWNAQRRIQGQLDAELDDTGHAQAAAVAQEIAELAPVLLWSSDSVRARQTAAYVSKETGLEPTYDARLREHHLAEREGLTHTEYAAVAPEEFAEFIRGNFDAVPGAETAAVVSERVVAAVTDVLESLAPGGLAVVVSHGMAIRDAVPVLLGRPVEDRELFLGLGNCAWVELEQPVPGASLRLRAYNRAVRG